KIPFVLEKPKMIFQKQYNFTYEIIPLNYALETNCRTRRNQEKINQFRFRRANQPCATVLRRQRLGRTKFGNCLCGRNFGGRKRRRRFAESGFSTTSRFAFFISRSHYGFSKKRANF